MAELLRQMLFGQLPEKMTIAYRGNKSRMEWGDAVLITDADAKASYELNPSRKTYQKVSLKEPSQAKSQKTEDKTKILGYEVQKYITEGKTSDITLRVEIWAAPDLEVNETLAANNPLTLGLLGTTAGIKGVPLRIDMTDSDEIIRFVFLATDLSETPPDPTLFEVPEDYTEQTPFD